MTLHDLEPFAALSAPAEVTPAQFKAQIMAAFEEGLIDADEAEDWIVLGGLEAA